MQLTLLQSDPNSDADALSFPNFLLATGEGCISSNHEDLVTLLPSISLQLDV